MVIAAPVQTVDEDADEGKGEVEGEDVDADREGARWTFTKLLAS